MEAWRGDPKEIELGKKIEEEVKQRLLERIQAQMRADAHREMMAKMQAQIDAIRRPQYDYRVKDEKPSKPPPKRIRWKKLLARIGGNKHATSVRPIADTDDSPE